MKLFKTADEKFAELGYKKIKETEYFVTYYKEKTTKYGNKFSYSHYIDIAYGITRDATVYSYSGKLIDDDKSENVVVGLTAKEMKLCMKKIKEKGGIRNDKHSRST